MATAGSFWWLRGVSPEGLPTLTLLAVAAVWAVAGSTPPTTTATRATHTATLRRLTGRARHMSASLPRRRGPPVALLKRTDRPAAPLPGQGTVLCGMPILAADHDCFCSTGSKAPR